MRPLLFLAMAMLCGSGLQAEDEAPADAWPMVRGSTAGTGRSAAVLQFPLVEAWQRRIEQTAFEATPVIADGTIYVGDLDGTFHALALATGTTRWTFTTDVGFPSAAAVSTDPALPVVVVGDAGGVVRAFDRRNGAVRWEYRTEGEISGGPTIVRADRGPRVLIGSQDASLACLMLTDGTVVWKHSIADQIRCSPTVATGSVFVAGCDGKLHVIDAETGAARAAVAIDGPTGTTPAAHGGRVFFGTEAGAFFAIDVQPASVAWKVEPTTKGQSYRSSAAIAGECAIVGSRGRAVEAFALADGTQRWRHPMRGRVDASPLVVHGDDSQETAIIGDSAGRIVALDTATGTPRWEFDAGGGFTAGAAVAAGRLVMAAEDGVIWCFTNQ